jgi:hypothetical protein
VIKKLIPNVSPEWIDNLKTKIKETPYWKSQGDRKSQVSKEMVDESIQTQQELFNSQIQSKVHLLGQIPIQQMMQQCMTTSTAGMSFNSPPATARDCGYGEGDAHCGEMMDFYDIAGDSKKQMGLFTSNEAQGKRNNT